MALFALLFAANLIIIGAGLRLLEVKYAHTRFGQALAFAY